MPVLDDNNGWTGKFEFTIEEDGDPVTYDEAVFVNSYYKIFKFAPANPAPSNPETVIVDTTEEANPDTGAPVFAVPAVIAVLCGAALLGKRK